MPLNSPSESLYPINQLQGLDESKIFSHKKDEKKYKYIAVDLQTNSLIQKKRKFVSLEFSQDLNKLLVVKHGHKSFMDSSTSGGKSINEKLLVLYVKGNEQDQCFKEMQKILNESFDLSPDNTLKVITSHFEQVWTNIKKFDNYGEMTRAFDDKTGEYILNSVNDLGKTYFEIEKKYQELNKNRAVSKECDSILDEMQRILADMKDIYDKNSMKFQHRATNTVSSVAQSFENLVSEFEKKAQQLEKAKNTAENNGRMEVLENNTIKLQTDCKNVIPSGTTCTEEIFDERKKINDKIDFLLASIMDLKKSSMTNFAVDGLEEKYKTLEKEVLELSEKISSPKVKNNSEEQKLQHELMKKHFKEEIQPILDNVQIYAKNTSPEKASVLNKIVADFKNLKQKIVDKANIKEINEIVTKIRDFIKDKLQMLAAPRGFFSTQGKSANLIQDLESNLANLVSQGAEETQGCYLSSRP